MTDMRKAIIEAAKKRTEARYGFPDFQPATKPLRQTEPRAIPPEARFPIFLNDFKVYRPLSPLQKIMRWFHV